MISIDVKGIKNEDAMEAFALLQTLKHFKHYEDLFTVSYQDNKYLLFIEDNMYEFDSFRNLSNYVISTFAKSDKELIDSINYKNTIISLGFSSTDAIEYLSFYSNVQKRLLKLK